MKLLCLVSLALCAIAHGAHPQSEILPPGISVSKDVERMQFNLHISEANNEQVNDAVLSGLEADNNVQNRVIGGVIENALEDFRQVIINGNDDVPVLDPLEVAKLGPFEYRLITGVRAQGTINNLRVEGLRWFLADRIAVNPLRLTIGVTVTVPWLTTTAGYDSRARVGLVTHNASGNIRIFAHRIEVAVDARLGTNLLAGHLVLRALDVKIDIHDTQISITGMTGSSFLNSLISATIQNITQDLIQNQLENVSQQISDELFDVINETLKDYTVSDIFG